MDYAKKEHLGAFLRHPVLGDPSFDTFEKVGSTVHRSQPPMEWAVNGSIFEDFDGSWYYFAGLYGRCYVSEVDFSHFIIYRSKDKGESWECLGDPFEKGFMYEGQTVASDGHPDAVLNYDKNTGKYVLAYDFGNNDSTWDTEFSSGDKPDSGAAIAVADSPAGPYTRLKSRVVSNRDTQNMLGRFIRMYATTVIPREHDYLALVLCDSNAYHAWALAATTAPTMEGPWSTPQLVLSADVPGYYPAPMEYYPAHVIGDRVYAPSTSVAKNRNFQCMHSAPLEQAHLAEAWTLEQVGSLWHSRRDPDEAYGIWGQTFHGFVEKDTGRYVVMYPSKNAEDLGTLSVAARPFDQPFSDGFTFSGHDGPSFTATYASYKNFRLSADITLSGTVSLGFGYQGLLGPDDPRSDAMPSKRTLAACTALRLTAAPEGETGTWAVVRLDAEGEETVLAQGTFPGRDPEKKLSLWMDYEGSKLKLSLGGRLHTVEAGDVPAGPLVLMADRFSLMTCSKFDVSGEALPFRLFYSANDALLGAGQRRSDWKELPGDTRLGTGNLVAKWNVTGNKFTLWAPKGPDYGKVAVYLDGRLLGSVVLTAEEETASAPVFSIGPVSYGNHAVTLRVLEGSYVLDRLEVEGPAQV